MKQFLRSSDNKHMSTVSEPQTKYRFLPFVKCTDHLIYIGLAVFILLGAVAVAWDKTDSEIGSAIALGAATVVMIFVMMVLVYLPRNRIAEEMLAAAKSKLILTEDSNKINREALENNQKQQKEDTIMRDAVANMQQVKFNIPEKVFPRKESNSIYQYLDKLPHNKYEAIKQYLDNFSIKPRFMIVTGSPGVGKTTIIKQALNKMKGVIPIYVNIESSDQAKHTNLKEVILQGLGAKETSLSFEKFIKTLSAKCRNSKFVIYVDMKVNGTISAEDLQLIGIRIGSFGRLLSELQCPFIIEISNSHISDSIINSRDFRGIFKEVRVHMTLEQFSLCCYAEMKYINLTKYATIHFKEFLECAAEWYFMVGNNPREFGSVLERVKESGCGQKRFHKSMFLRVGTRKGRVNG